MNWFAIFWRNYCQLLIDLMMVPKYWLDRCCLAVVLMSYCSSLKTSVYSM